MGDSLDKVDFSNDENWVKNDVNNKYGGNTVDSDGSTFDVYTTSNDTRVEVKVEVEIQDSI